MSCWNYVGYFKEAGYTDAEVFCSVLDEDAHSYYIVRGIQGSQADTLGVFPGSGTDGRWMLRTRSWPVDAGGYSWMDIIHVDARGVITGSDVFATSGGMRSLADGESPVSVLEEYEANPGPGSEIEIVNDPLSSPQDADFYCADVVIYSSIKSYLGPVFDHVKQYTLPGGDSLKVTCVWGPADFEHQRGVMIDVYNANIAYNNQAGPGDRIYPVLPGPIGIFVGDKSQVRYNLWDDDPVHNACVLPQCRSYNDIGDMNGNGVAECAIMVMYTTDVEDLQARLLSASEWNTGIGFVNESGRAIILSGDYTPEGPVGNLNKGLGSLEAAYLAQGTPAIVLRETDYADAWQRWDAIVQAVNEGVEAMWFQGVDTAIRRFTRSLSLGASFPRHLLTLNQRYVAFGLSCENTAVHFMMHYDWMYELLSSGSGSIMVGLVGQMNGDWAHRHELVLELYKQELDNKLEEDYLVHVNWRVNYLMATQFDESNYGRGSTLFANGLIVPPRGRLSTATVSDPVQHPPNRVLWSVPIGVGRHIYFSMDNVGEVNLTIYDVTGRKVSTVVDGVLGSGQHGATWYGRYRSGEKVPSGVYFARLKVNGRQVATEKVLVVR